MIINGDSLLELAPIKDMETTKINTHGVSYGLGEVGYDIRLKQDIVFLLNEDGPHLQVSDLILRQTSFVNGRFTIASAIEEFHLPDNLMGIVHDKSSWARQGLSVFNTVIEPGWRGYLTLELVFHGNDRVHIPAGAGIAQVVFHELVDRRAYQGKYQDQKDEPTQTIFVE